MFEALPCETLIARPPLRSAPSLANTRLASFTFLTTAELIALEDCTASRGSVKAGTELIQEGDAVENLYFLVEGWACQYTTVRDGRRQISALLLPGDICNLDALLFEQLDCGVRMLSAGTVLPVPREQVAALASTYSGIAQGFTWLGFIENAILARRTLCLGRLSARERVAHLLCELAVRLGFNQDEGEISFDMPLTQEHLADALGLTPVHVNRTLQQLRTEGLLASTKRIVAIFDVAALRRAGEFQPGYLHVQGAQNGAANDQRKTSRRGTSFRLNGRR